MKVKKLLELLSKVDPEKNIKLLDDGNEGDLVNMFGFSIQMVDEEKEGDDIIFCSENTFEAFLD